MDIYYREILNKLSILCVFQESDIPLSLLPKHVFGLHAGDGLAFVKDFENNTSSSRPASSTVVSMKNGVSNGHTVVVQNGGSHNGAAAGAFPDILNGRGE